MRWILLAVVLIAGCAGPAATKVPSRESTQGEPDHATGDAYAPGIAEAPALPCDAAHTDFWGAAFPVRPAFIGDNETVARRFAAALDDTITGPLEPGGGLQPAAWPTARHGSLSAVSTPYGAHFYYVVHVEAIAPRSPSAQPYEHGLSAAQRATISAFANATLDHLGVLGDIERIQEKGKSPDGLRWTLLQRDPLNATSYLMSANGLVSANDNWFSLGIGPVYAISARHSDAAHLAALAQEDASCLLASQRPPGFTNGTTVNTHLKAHAIYRSRLVADFYANYPCQFGACRTDEFLLDVVTGALVRGFKHQETPFIDDDWPSNPH